MVRQCLLKVFYFNFPCVFCISFIFRQCVLKLNYWVWIQVLARLFYFLPDLIYMEPYVERKHLLDSLTFASK